MRALRTETRSLPVPLTPSEVVGRADSMAQLRRRLFDLKLREKAAKEDFAQRREQMEADHATLDQQLIERAERRTIECSVLADDAAKKIYVVRLDTQEVIDARFMTGSEQQISLAEEELDPERAARFGASISEYLERQQARAAETAPNGLALADLLDAAYRDVVWPSAEELEAMPPTSREAIGKWAAGAAIWEEAPSELRIWIAAHGFRKSLAHLGYLNLKVDLLSLSDEQVSELRAFLDEAFAPADEDAFKPQPPEWLV